MNNVDLMIEREVAKLWEEQTAPAVDGETLRRAAQFMRCAVCEMDKAADFVYAAAQKLEDTPQGDRVTSVLFDMENMMTNLKQLQKAFEKGV